MIQVKKERKKKKMKERNKQTLVLGCANTTSSSPLGITLLLPSLPMGNLGANLWIKYLPSEPTAGSFNLSILRTRFKKAHRGLPAGPAIRRLFCCKKNGWRVRRKSRVE